MPHLNHLIVWCVDKHRGAQHVVDVLGLDEISHWADPSKRAPGEINRHDGGRGVYWEDPDGHLLEIITRPYGAETEASGG